MRLKQNINRNQGDENIVPMINVVFLLLIFFLIAGTLTPRPPFKFNPVQTEEQPAIQAPSNAIYVSAIGALYYSGRTLGLDDVEAVVIRKSDGAEDPIDVFVDRETPGEILFPVIERLGRSKIVRIRLITERGTGK